MDTEYHALLNNNTWLLVPPPPHGNIIRSIGILIILIYVDDISGTRSSATQIHSFISRLSSVFALRDLGPIIYFLDIKVHRSSTYLHLNQTKYKHDLLKRIAIIEAKSALTLVNKACQFIAHPASAHSLVVKRILRYLKGTSAHGLLLHSSFPLLFKDTLMPTRHLVQMIIQALVAIASF
ncbi:putative mitochondrial protein [Vitis vinifera]|uniref:Putative mitochondrial protein n=1 Tax=Vitis vinifera TaxID=29760 RepID=A0A438HZI6_VITVI|nr:putative mitochondrial protein [Vitis vinifera]